MRYYYQLQYKRIHRSFKDFGTEPFIGYPIIVMLFYWLSSVFFDRVVYANYVYVLIGAIFAYSFSNPEHSKFVKQHFSTSGHLKIMVLNNLIKVTPFAMFLVHKMYYIETLLICLLAFFISFMKKRSSTSIIIPTPFGKKPAEFIIGFRKTVWLFFLIYSLTFIAVFKGNFNLGVFSLVSVFLVCSSYYMKPDPEFYIWIHAMNAKEFLKYKMLIAFKYSLLLTLPILVVLSIFYLDQMHITLIFLGMGWLYLAMYILIRYAFQNQGLEMLQGIIGVLCLLFPPVMIITIPYFYTKAIHNLDLLLK
ncbi:hypothetical protein [uncultured Aquimarina sp.]|uniref:hypothetical protein n=1 Tax=uncultured Aquimarina sp. TaxID=575652 RepID=UPI002607C515|nr:hypothetical protein [uncultured Aquimarina sp.]